MSSIHTLPPTVVDRARHCLDQLDGLGYDFFTGVPCSLLNPLYAALGDGRRPYYPATREDLSVGLAAGAAMVGKRPVVLMQNSGLGVSINALLSLQRMYELPLLSIISWRGHGPDAPEHVDVGARMPALLEALGIPWRHLADDDAFEPEFHTGPEPLVALLVRPKELERSGAERGEARTAMTSSPAAEALTPQPEASGAPSGAKPPSPGHRPGSSRPSTGEAP